MSGLYITRYLYCVKIACTHAALKRQEQVQLGFKYDHILMEVKDIEFGESQPSTFFYQNPEEIEYIVAVFMLFEQPGPTEKITYNDKKSLIKDMCVAQCTDNPMIGM